MTVVIELLSNSCKSLVINTQSGSVIYIICWLLFILSFKYPPVTYMGPNLGALGSVSFAFAFPSELNFLFYFEGYSSITSNGWNGAITIFPY